MSHLMGIDVGTTGVKVLIIDENGTVCASSVEEYPLSTPHPNWAEQNPEDWWDATIKAIRNVLEKSGGASVEGIGLSGQMHGAVFIDRDGKVLRPCIMWCDQRTAKQCVYITETVGEDRLFELTCNPALTGFTAPKIVWVKEEENEVFRKAYKILLPKDYIRFLLTGVFATEVSDASGTVLFDVKKRRWSKEMLSALEIPEDLMPEVFESPEVSGRISAEASSLTGLAGGTPVVGGGGDQAAGAVGNGIVREGIISSTIGTSGVVFASCDEVRVEPGRRLHTFCHAVPGKWHLMGVMLSAGGSLRWLRDAICHEEVREAKEKGIDPYDIMTEEASQAPPGCEGLIFLPYLSGERTPYPDPDARGVFFGLTLRHKKEHLIRSVMEGIAYGLRDSLELMKGIGARMSEVRASGGGARSSLWRQIQADVNNLEMQVISVDEGPAFGVALLAGVGVGIFNNVEEACSRTIKVKETIKPIKANVTIYERYYEIYHSLYPALKDTYKHIAELT